jgi:hypothetical protein
VLELQGHHRDDSNLSDGHLCVFSSALCVDMRSIDQDVVWHWGWAALMLSFLVQSKRWSVVPISDWQCTKILVVICSSRAVDNDRTEYSITVLGRPMRASDNLVSKCAVVKDTI